MSLYGKWIEMVKELIKMGMPVRSTQGVSPMGMIASIIDSHVGNRRFSSFDVDHLADVSFFLLLPSPLPSLLTFHLYHYLYPLLFNSIF